MSKSKRALIYGRLSPSPKGQEAKGGNLDQQVSLSRAICDRNGWEVVDVITEVDTSATSSKPRKGWQEVVRRIEAGDVDVVVGRHYDRLYRRVSDLEQLVTLVERHGVRLVAAEAGDDGLDLTTATGRAQARYMAVGAALETDIKRERQVRGHERRAEAGRPWWNARPFGFERNGEHREDEAELLRAAYGDILDGHSLYGIAQRWNRDGVKTPKDNAWRSSNLRTVLVNPRNAAIHTYRGQETGQEATWEPIVSEEVYRAAVRLLSAPERRPEGSGGKRKGLLTYVARCGKPGCHGRMTRLLSKPRADGSRDPMYTCRHCRGTRIPADWLDNYVIWSVVMRTRADDWLDTLAPQPVEGADERAADLRVEKAALESRKEGLAEAFTDGEIDRAALRAGSEKANKRIAEIDAELQTLVIERVSREHVADDIEYLFHLFALDKQDTAEHDRLRSIFDAVIERIEVLPRGKGKRAPEPTDVRITFRDGREFRPTQRSAPAQQSPSPVWEQARAEIEREREAASRA